MKLNESLERLRADFKNRRFARNRGEAFTGRIKKREFARNGELHLRANFKNRRFARNRGEAFTGRIKKTGICP